VCPAAHPTVRRYAGVEMKGWLRVDSEGLRTKRQLEDSTVLFAQRDLDPCTHRSSPSSSLDDGVRDPPPRFLPTNDSGNKGAAAAR